MVMVMISTKNDNHKTKQTKGKKIEEVVVEEEEKEEEGRYKEGGRQKRETSAREGEEEQEQVEEKRNRSQSAHVGKQISRLSYLRLVNVHQNRKGGEVVTGAAGVSRCLLHYRAPFRQPQAQMRMKP